MHAKALEIAWHDSSAIWSLDISPTSRLVTAGGDKAARVWRLAPAPHAHLARHAARDRGKPARPCAADAAVVDWLCDLRAHTTTVNVARFTRDGATIATGADQGEIVLWRLDPGDPGPAPLADEPAPRERWLRVATLRGHVQDVLDLAWSADGSRLVSASIDNAVKVWDVRNAAKTPVALRNHANFVQGVSIDPFGRLIASLGNDRALRVFTTSAANSWFQVASLSSVTVPSRDGHMPGDARLFVDDSKFVNCFRRLAWSPDGSVVACPTGIHFPHAKRLFAVHIFARNCWAKPAAQCGGLTKPACAVRFSPVLYELRRNAKRDASNTKNETGASSTPVNSFPPPPPPPQGPFATFTYRMMFAVLTLDAVLFYDTESLTRPFATVEGLHCAEHTDITWSPDGLTAAVSSVDGYVSLVCFTPEELGAKLAPENTPQWLDRQEELMKSMSLRSPSKSAHVPVSVVKPKSVNAGKAAPEKPLPTLPSAAMAPVNTESVAGKSSSSQQPVHPSPPPANGPVKPVVSLLDSIEGHLAMTKTAGGSHRISLPEPANNAKSVNPSSKPASENTSAPRLAAAKAVQAAVSEMLLCENTETRRAQSPSVPIAKQSTRTPFLSCATGGTLSQGRQGSDEGAKMAAAVLENECQLQAVKSITKEVEVCLEPDSQQSGNPSASPPEVRCLASPRKAISIDPETLLQDAGPPSTHQNVGKDAVTSPSEKDLSSTIPKPASDSQSQSPQVIMSKGRPKARKVQTTLSFGAPPKTTASKASRRQNIPETRELSSDGGFVQNTSSLVRKHVNQMPGPSPLPKDADGSAPATAVDLGLSGQDKSEHGQRDAKRQKVDNLTILENT